MSPFHFKTRGGLVSLFHPKPDHLSTCALELARRSSSFYRFERQLAGASILLDGPGDIQDAYPCPFPGYLLALLIWDQTTMRYDFPSSPVTISANDRVSVYAQNMGSDFTLKARINGVTRISVPAIPYFSLVAATIYLRLNRGAM